MKSSLPLGVVVDKNVVLHGQLKIWDLFTHPARQREETCQVLLCMYVYTFFNCLIVIDNAPLTYIKLTEQSNITAKSNQNTHHRLTV